MFFNLGTIVFIRVSFQGIEEPLIDHDTKLISVVEFFDFFDEEHKGVFSLNDKIFTLITQFIVSFGLLGQKTACQSKLN